MTKRERLVADLRSARDEARRSVMLCRDMASLGMGGEANDRLRLRFERHALAIGTAIALLERSARVQQ